MAKLIPWVVFCVLLVSNVTGQTIELVRERDCHWLFDKSDGKILVYRAGGPFPKDRFLFLNIDVSEKISADWEIEGVIGYYDKECRFETLFTGPSMMSDDSKPAHYRGIFFELADGPYFVALRLHSPTGASRDALTANLKGADAIKVALSAPEQPAKEPFYCKDIDPKILEVELSNELLLNRTSNHCIWIDADQFEFRGGSNERIECGVDVSSGKGYIEGHGVNFNSMVLVKRDPKMPKCSLIGQRNARVEVGGLRPDDITIFVATDAKVKFRTHFRRETRDEEKPGE